MSAILLALCLGAGQEPKPELPPLTEEQRQRISKLANDAQQEAIRLRGLLEKRQQDLTRLYGEYELDEKEAKKIEAEILDLQKQLLVNYHKMQVELRTLVSKERFVVLKKRLDNLLQTKEKKP